MTCGEGNLGTEALECISRVPRLESQVTGLTFLGTSLDAQLPIYPEPPSSHSESFRDKG